VLVYWLYDETCAAPRTHGYVGVTTTSLAKRARTHRYKTFRWKPFSATVLFAGASTECLRVEWELRPHAGIGWNIMPGGHHATAVRGCPESTREKIRAARLNQPCPRTGKKHSPEAVKKMRASPIRLAWTGERNPFFGKKHSAETCAKMRAKRALQITTDETRAKMRAAWARRKSSPDQVALEGI
jgi:hypothetical protein